MNKILAVERADAFASPKEKAEGKICKKNVDFVASVTKHFSNLYTRLLKKLANFVEYLEVISRFQGVYFDFSTLNS